MTSTDTPPIADWLEDFRRQWAPDMVIGQHKPKEVTEDEIRQQIRHQRLAAFRELCPPEFSQKIDRSKIPNTGAWDQADVWQGAFPGLWLWSHATGKGKSRMLWRQFGKLHVDFGRDVVRATGQQLAEDYFRFYMAGNPREFYRRLMRHDVIMIDDLDKADFRADRTVRMLRELWDFLYEANKPVLVTANEDITEIENRLGMSGGRRIRHVCREVCFG